MNRRSILLVTVDCLRADHVGFMGYARPTTPFLDRLAAESFVFPAATVAGAPTFYSLPAILASRYPLSLGRDVLGLAPQEPTLASVLQQAGYATAAFSAANPYISSRQGYAHGFDKFRDYLNGTIDGYNPDSFPDDREGPTPANGWASRLNRRLQKARPALGPLGVVYDELYFQYCQRAVPAATSLDQLRRFPAADVIVSEARRWIESIGDEPFFLWLHLMDPHSPYYPKNEALALLGDAPVSPFRARYLNHYWNRADLGPRRLARHRNEIVALYDGGIRWADRHLEQLVLSLQESGRWSDCIFVLTADHGEEFLDHEGRYHPPLGLREELIRVPLLLRVPAVTKKEVAMSPFSLLHLAPTLLDTAEVPVPSAFQGKSYWTQVREGERFDSVAISECVAGCGNPLRREKRMAPRVLSVRETRYKLTLTFDPQRDELYDLQADPGERVPLAPGQQKAVRKRLLEVAREHVRHSLEQRDLSAPAQARLLELRLEWNIPADKSPPVAS